MVNTGARSGVEIVQCYVRDCVSSVTTPAKALAAFARVDLAPGETRRVTLDVPFAQLALVTETLARLVEPGEFEVMVGPSSRDGDLFRAAFRVVG